MSIRFTCRRCKEEVTARDSAAGEEMDCPSCGTELTVPRGGVRREGDRPRLAPDRRRDEDEEAPPSRRDRDREADDEKPGTGVQLGMGIPALVLGILSTLVAIIPCVGWISLPFSGIALLLGLVGLVVAAMRRWSGLGFPIAGTLVSLLAIGIGIGQIFYARHVALETQKKVAAEAEEMGKVMAAQQIAEQQRQARMAEIEREKYKPGKPLALAWQNDVAYLTELEEFDVRGIGPWRRLGKRGMQGINRGQFNEQDREIRVGGMADKNALTLNPPANGFSSVKYRLDGLADRLKGEVAVNDGAIRPAVGVTFEILADNKPLWKSKAIQAQGDKQAFDQSVKGVREIELRVHYAAIDNTSVFPVWLNTHVTRGDKK